eukprot:Tamp_12663.p1 GENE.Tamp_12663~~Tamp_12663.p1  ORF type:complete len:440 (+),score=20.52 Tamp_12663:266-1585(+)
MATHEYRQATRHRPRHLPEWTPRKRGSSMTAKQGLPAQGWRACIEKALAAASSASSCLRDEIVPTAPPSPSPVLAADDLGAVSPSSRANSPATRPWLCAARAWSFRRPWLRATNAAKDWSSPAPYLVDRNASIPSPRRAALAAAPPPSRTTASTAQAASNSSTGPPTATRHQPVAAAVPAQATTERADSLAADFEASALDAESASGTDSHGAQAGDPAAASGGASRGAVEGVVVGGRVVSHASTSVPSEGAESDARPQPRVHPDLEIDPPADLQPERAAAQHAHAHAPAPSAPSHATGHASPPQPPLSPTASAPAVAEGRVDQVLSGPLGVLLAITSSAPRPPSPPPPPSDASHVAACAVTAIEKTAKEAILAVKAEASAAAAAQGVGDSRDCVVCLAQPSSMAFLPCGHRCTCEECAPTLEMCPLCRTTVKQCARIYV